MSDGGFGWESLLATDAPPGCSLRTALFTTYDRPDERLLVEHLLPVLLRLGHEPDGEGAERQYFLLELDRRLKQLHGRLAVVSSTTREEPADPGEGDSGTYGWVWCSIRHLTVGSRGRAVQHAKLWMLHWAGDGTEYLEIVVSSANLTRAAFRGQVQVAWRCCVELSPQSPKRRLRGWGILPAFLDHLAASAAGAEQVMPLRELLRRAECPAGVSFVASVPGRHSRAALRTTPWGAAGLSLIAPKGRGVPRVSVLAPFVGGWSGDALARWCSWFGGATNRLELVWIAKCHPWATRWQMPETALAALREADTRLLRLRHDAADPDGIDRFHGDHRPADERWGHAKVYALRCGSSRRVLVTSANFSPAAWGALASDGTLVIENFELGVCVEGAGWPFDALEEFGGDAEPATVSALTGYGGALITWAQAEWVGAEVAVRCRCEPDNSVVGEVTGSGESRAVERWGTDGANGLLLARVPWPDAARPPSQVRLECGYEALSVPVFDARPAPERELSVPTEVDGEAVQRMRDELLFEQYGGQVPSEDVAVGEVTGVITTDEDEVEGGGGGPADSYDVPVFTLARQYLDVVDVWADHLARAERSADGNRREAVLRDGHLLLAALARQRDRDTARGPGLGIAARLVAEELAVRVKYTLEE